ncbi:MAG: c-type cytochrome [Gaiellaceae bacterium]
MRPAVVVSAACAALVSLALTGCGTGGYSTDGSQGLGKQLFLEANCGACHVLAAAGTAGVIGPNLDDAFAQARAAGMTSETFTQVVRDQVLFPITETSTGAPGMPGPNDTIPECGDVEEGDFCVPDQHQAATDIGVYVGAVAGTGVTVDKPTDGKTIFMTSCGSCHTLSDAGTSGNVGPNLDSSKPSKELVVDRVTNGQGAMPSFSGSLDEAQIQAVADYVSSSAGR